MLWMNTNSSIRSLIEASSCALGRKIAGFFEEYFIELVRGNIEEPV
jgi:hypothetical protein